MSDSTESASSRLQTTRSIDGAVITSQKQATRKILDNVARNLQRISQITERIARARMPPILNYQEEEDDDDDDEPIKVFNFF